MSNFHVASKRVQSVDNKLHTSDHQYHRCPYSVLHSLLQDFNKGCFLLQDSFKTNIKVCSRICRQAPKVCYETNIKVCSRISKVYYKPKSAPEYRRSATNQSLLQNMLIGMKGMLRNSSILASRSLY